MRATPPSAAPADPGASSAAQRARVSVGLPVYNGENFVAAAIESVLAQSFREFRLVISDNASTDRTRQICEDFARADPRVEYHRAEVNRGIVWNSNQVFRLSRTDYFMWLSHDDGLAPQYLERCVGVLDSDASVVSCYAACRDIDGSGGAIGIRRSRVAMDDPDPVVRFREGIRLEHLCEPWCSVTRSEALRLTQLFGLFADYDRVLIAELGLHGRVVEIPEALFINREHDKRSHQVYATRVERTRWLDPRNTQSLIFPHFRELQEMWAAVRRAGLTRSERARCAWELVKWSLRYRRRLFSDLDFAAREVARKVLKRHDSRAKQ